jgi:hypothetical protein
LFRRFQVRAILRRSGSSWPINEAAGKKPDGWNGWPEQKQFAFVLTHDVESSAGLSRVKFLAEIELEMGFRSSFNFVPEGGYRVPRELRFWLENNGFEVGVHDLHHDGRLYDSREEFVENAKRINHYLEQWNAVGFRSAFMLRNLQWLQDLDIEYDASTFDTDPFEPEPDGAATIFPFWVSSGNGHGYVELPYTLAQDSTLFLLLRENSMRLWRDKLAWVVQNGGMALVNVHPDYMCFSNRPKRGAEFSSRIYRDFLVHVKQSQAGRFWHALPRQVAHFCSTGKRRSSQTGMIQAPRKMDLQA